MIACLEAGKVLGIHNDKEKEFEKVLNRLRPNQIDSMGTPYGMGRTGKGTDS